MEEHNFYLAFKKYLWATSHDAQDLLLTLLSNYNVGAWEHTDCQGLNEGQWDAKHSSYSLCNCSVLNNYFISTNMLSRCYRLKGTRNYIVKEYH